MSEVDKAPDRQQKILSANITRVSLADIFDGDWIRDGTSNQQLLQWGKYDAIYKQLKTDPNRGISSDPASLQERRQRFGTNAPIIRKQTSFLQFVIESFDDPMLRVLCIAAVVSLVLGILTEGIEEGWLEGTSILVAICLIVSVTSVNNYVKEQQFNKLNAIAKKKSVNVVRDGEVKTVDAYDLLVGDVVKIETGQILSADGILLRSYDLGVDESAMTGESLTIYKKIPSDFTKKEGANPYLISGSMILQGSGEMLVLAVGQNSQYGRIQQKLSMTEDATPLQQKLQLLANNIGKVGTVAAILTFSSMMLHLLYDFIMCPDRDEYYSMETVKTIIQYFTIAVSIIVVAVPEGLPLAVTIALAYSVGKMKDENNLVRYLSACQTMGGANNICTDKTGTLTKNTMQVLRIFTNNQIYEASNNKIPEVFKQKFSIGCCLNSNAYPTIDENGKFSMMGSKTQCALLQQAYKYGYDFRKIRKFENYRIQKVFPFSSIAKRMAVAYETQGKSKFALKGAPDFVLHNCQSYILNDKVVPVDDDFKRKVTAAIQEFSSATLRTLLVAEKDCEPVTAADPIEAVEKGLTFIGLIGIRDPLRPEIADSIKKCKRAGITVRMLTGDNETTAIAIAKEAGILQADWKHGQAGKEYAVMQGKDFRAYVQGVIKLKDGSEVVKNLENFRKVQQQLKVLARSSPEDKYIMATGLKQLDHVVAMTGDGTNDAPALKKADIGFAMGITGTQVAKDAAGIILLDDNFTSIVTATKWGRNIIESIRKFLQFQLTVNAVALFIAFIGSVVLKQSPLTPIQMLWVNLIMDTFASLALATEPPSEQLLNRKPYSRFESLITPQMWKNIIMHALMQIVILGTILFYGPQLFNIPSSVGLEHYQWNEHTGQHYSIFFNVFVLLQLFNQINSRKLKNSEVNVFEGFFNNKLFLFILVLTFAIQFSLICFGGRSVRVTSLTLEQHLICYTLGSFSLVFGFISKKFGPSGFNIRQNVRLPSKNYDSDKHKKD